jgi:ribosomal protection tetracycline resistance protein
MGAVHDVGKKLARLVVHDDADPQCSMTAMEVLAGNDDAVLSRFLAERPLAPAELRRVIARQTARFEVLPVYFGAALTGVGVDDLMDAIPWLLPPADVPTTGPASGTVFKIERGPNGEKITYARIFGGTLRTRDRVRLGRDPSATATVTAIEVFHGGTTTTSSVAPAGEIAKLHGLTTARIGDEFGPVTRTVDQRAFAPPAMETAVVPRHAGQKRAVFEALIDLAEQDPLIDLRQDDTRQELFLSLYGEVQKEIVAQTLERDYGLPVEFRPTTPVCIERPNRRATAVEPLPPGRSPTHPFLAGVGLAVSPLPAGTGVTFELDVGVKSVPIHVFGSIEAFRQVMERTVHESLGQGLHGWQVTDCRVVMTECSYQAPPRKWPGTTLSDYRLLTPLVLMGALTRAGTTVLEPVLEFHLELPLQDLGPVMAVLRELDAQPGPPASRGSIIVLEGVIRVARLHHLQRRLPDLTRGEGVLESHLAGYQPVEGAPPSRPRTDRNPLDRQDYLRRVSQGT